MLKRLIFIALLAILTSCSTKKSVHYFQDSLKTESLNNYLSPSVQKGDILDINIKALDIESVSMFQSNNAGNIAGGSIETRKLNGYKVNSSGEIDLPLLGTIKVMDLSTNQISTLLEEKLKSFVVNPAVKTTIINFKFSVLGEVKSPQTFNIIDDKITIIQAIGMAGDLTINGSREDVMVLRYTDGVQTTAHINLTSANFLSGAYQMVKPNDVIIVNPNSAKVSSAGYVGNLSAILGIASIVLSSIILITR